MSTRCAVADVTNGGGYAGNDRRELTSDKKAVARLAGSAGAEALLSSSTSVSIIRQFLFASEC
jgi:hypothetical protein